MGLINRRKRIVVNKEAQRRIVLAVSLLPAIALAMAMMIIAVFCRRLFGEAVRTEAALPSLIPLFLSTLGFALASIFIILNQALRFSHRVVGPGYRLQQAFKLVQAGDLKTRIKLRDGDHLTEVADSYNEFLSWLEKHPPQGLQVESNETTTQSVDTIEAPAPEPATADRA